MMTLIKDMFERISNKYKEWDILIVKVLNNEEDSSEGLKALEEFTDILKQIIEMLKNESVSMDEIQNLFENYACKEHAIKYIDAHLRTYHSFDAIRKLEKDDIYKAKRCIDQIWESYILRYNPYFDNQENRLLSDTEYRSVAREIDRLTDLCIERNFHILAISKQFEEKSGLSGELCNYISQKIDENFEKLKLSYIIYNITEK